MSRCKHDPKLWEPLNPNDADEIGFANRWRCTICGEVRSAPSAERKAQIRRYSDLVVYAIPSLVVIILAATAYIVWR